MLNKTLLVAGAGTMIAMAQPQEGVFVGGAPVVAEKIGIVSNFAHSEFASGGPVVKNAPYQAQAVTETVQVLADGNRITRRNSAAVARDSEGRTRRDISVAGVAAKITVIHDPVANVSYTLDHEAKTARRMKGRGVVIQWESRAAAGNMRNQQTTADVITYGHAMAGPALPPGELLLEGGPTTFNIRVRSKEDAKTESLGKQTIDGVIAEGTRVTNTIPAGEIGNERPIEIVFERWYSPELQLVISSKHKDPMMGETTYKLNNLSRNEPLKSLFEVPQDYAVKEADEPGDVLRRKIEKD